MNDSGELTRFVARAHRRHVAQRLLEHAGIGMALGAAIAMVAANTLENVIILIALGALVGLLIGWLRRPSRVNSAMEADRQFGLKDLLGSALTIKNPADPWQRAVVATAEARVRAFSPSGLKFRRLNASGWCLIGGVALISMGMRMWSDAAPAEQATAQRRIFLDRDELNGKSDWMEKANPPVIADAMTDSTDRSEMASQAAGPSDQPADAIRPGSGLSTQNSPAGSPDQAGLGSAQTKTSTPTPIGQPDAGSSQPDQAEGRPAGGTGEPANHADGNSDQGSLAGGNGQPAHPTAPWQSNQWSTSWQSAAQAVQNGQVPGRYRDLVRAYFSIESP